MVTATAGNENGQFCIAVGLATRTAGTRTQLVKGAGRWLLRRGGYPADLGHYLVGFNPRRFKTPKGDKLPRYKLSMRNIL